MSAIALVATSVATRADAEAMADALVGEGLAACVQLAAVASTYRWQGAVECAEEWRVVKTTTLAAAAAAARIAALHAYELPEIMTHAVDAAPGYAAWVAESVTGR